MVVHDERAEDRKLKPGTRSTQEAPLLAFGVAVVALVLSILEAGFAVVNYAAAATISHDGHGEVGGAGERRYRAFCGVDVAGDAGGTGGVCGAILRALRGAGGIPTSRWYTRRCTKRCTREIIGDINAAI